MKSTRAAFTAGSIAALAGTGFLRSPAQAAEFTYKLGINKPTNHPQVIRSIAAAQAVDQLTNGRLHIDVFPANQLGGDTEVLSQLRSGAVQLLQVADSGLTGVLPAAGIDALAFTFQNYKQCFDALDGALGTYIRSGMPKIGLYAFDKVWCSGLKQVCNSVKPIVTPDDLHGMKLRVPLVAVEVAAFKALGAAPAPISFSETYVAMQTKLVEGADLPLVTIETGKYYEVQQYVSILNAGYTGDTMMANADAWQKLPADLRDVCEKTFNAAALQERQDILTLEASIETRLKGHGMAFNRPALDPFRAAIKKAGLYAQWRDMFGAQPFALLEQYVGPLA